MLYYNYSKGNNHNQITGGNQYDYSRIKKRNG